MDRSIIERKARRRVGIPAFIALAAAAAVVTLLLYWSTSRMDTVSFERQELLVSRVLDESAANLATEQESLDLKDNMVRMFLAPIVSEMEIQRLNNNVGPQVHKYYGHDETYVLTGDDFPLYGMRDGRVEKPQTFESLRTVAAPVVAALRAQTAKLPVGQPLSSSPGAYDITVVNGHPAILSVKPIISNSGRVPQPPGREFLQISILRLDGRYLQRLSHNYGFEGARFAWSKNPADKEASRPFISPRTNQVVGYFLWKPYRPGSIVLRDMLPVLALTLLLIGTMIHFLVRRINRGTAQLQASEAQAKHLAFHDVLTGLPNRALFNDRLDRTLASTRRLPDQQVALLCMDLDRFKQVNDTLGHAAGDELIRELGRRLSHVVREADTVARLGGDEFAVIMTDVRSQHDIAALCGRILAAVKGGFDVMGSKAFVGISIGVARAGVDGFDRAELARKGDIALYRAKAEGRGRYEIFAEEMDSTVQNRQAIEYDLRKALEEGGQLQVYYQPKYDAASKNVVGVEALVRWQHPTKGLIWPSTFVQIAEETGLIEALGEWVLAESCHASLNWPHATLSVNISPIQLRNPFFAQRVFKILAETGVDPGNLELEITETAFLDNVDQCELNLKMLRMAGVRIALDDFGTGYSSFTHLTNFRVDRLKIDRSFTAAIENPDGGSAIIQAIVSLAQSSGLKITAEGVETVEQSDFLCSIGCDELQGYLMSKPMPKEAIDMLLGVDAEARAPTLRTARAVGM
jgi:diguanylate cyclase (GGDEF)-like protein